MTETREPPTGTNEDNVTNDVSNATTSVVAWQPPHNTTTAAAGKPPKAPAPKSGCSSIAVTDYTPEDEIMVVEEVGPDLPSEEEDQGKVYVES